VGFHRLYDGLQLNLLKSSGHCTHRQFNIRTLYVLPTQCVYVFCVDLGASLGKKKKKLFRTGKSVILVRQVRGKNRLG
jgi:hypothetical protein